MSDIDKATPGPWSIVAAMRDQFMRLLDEVERLRAIRIEFANEIDRLRDRVKEQDSQIDRAAKYTKQLEDRVEQLRESVENLRAAGWGTEK